MKVRHIAENLGTSGVRPNRHMRHSGCVVCRNVFQLVDRFSEALRPVVELVALEVMTAWWERLAVMS